jgi:hypothetical protein
MAELAQVNAELARADAAGRGQRRRVRGADDLAPQIEALRAAGRERIYGEYRWPRFRTFQACPKDLPVPSGATLACGKLAHRVPKGSPCPTSDGAN